MIQAKMPEHQGMRTSHQSVYWHDSFAIHKSLIEEACVELRTAPHVLILGAYANLGYKVVGRKNDISVPNSIRKHPLHREESDLNSTEHKRSYVAESELLSVATVLQFAPPLHSGPFNPSIHWSKIVRINTCNLEGGTPSPILLWEISRVMTGVSDPHQKTTSETEASSTDLNFHFSYAGATPRRQHLRSLSSINEPLTLSVDTRSSHYRFKVSGGCQAQHIEQFAAQYRGYLEESIDNFRRRGQRLTPQPNRHVLR